MSEFQNLSATLYILPNFSRISDPWLAYKALFTSYLESLEVPGPHVLGGVDPEAPDADADEVVDVLGDLVLDVVLAVVEVVQAHQVAVANLKVNT